MLSAICAVPDEVMQPVIPIHSKWKLASFSLSAAFWPFIGQHEEEEEEEKKVRHVNVWHVLRLNAHTIEKCVWPRVLRTQQFNKFAKK